MTDKPTPDALEHRTFTPIDGDTVEPQADAAPEPEALTAAQIIGGALAAGREVFCLVTKMDSPRKTLDDDTAQRIGALWGPVLDKHGIDLGKYLGDYALEAAAIIGTVTIAASVRRGVMDEMAAMDKQASTTHEAETVE